MQYQLNYWTTLELQEGQEVKNTLCTYCDLQKSVHCHAIDNKCTCQVYTIKDKEI